MDELLDKILELKNQGLNRQQIADALNLSFWQVQRRLKTDYQEKQAWKRLKEEDKQLLNLNSEPKIVDGGIIEALPATVLSDCRHVYDEEMLKSTIGMIKNQGVNQGKLKFEKEYESVWIKGDDSIIPSPLKEVDSALFSSQEFDRKRETIRQMIEAKYGNQAKILMLNDLHIPFHNMEIINKAVYNSDADICVVNGDMLDLYTVSKYSKDKNISLKQEVDEGRALLQFLSRRFKDVILTDGNHERRLRRYIKEQIDQTIQFLFNANILETVAEGFDNVHIAGGFWIKLWDVIFAHPDNYSSSVGRTVINTSQYFRSRGIDHNVVLLGHTHKYIQFKHQGVLLMEGGCQCYEMDYHRSASMTMDAWVEGYTEFSVKDGLCDQNSLKFHMFQS